MQFLAIYFFCVNTHFLFIERADLPHDLSIEQCCQKQGVIEGHMDYARSTLSLRLSKNWLLTLLTNGTFILLKGRVEVSVFFCE